MKQVYLLAIFSLVVLEGKTQNCGAVQSLTGLQQTQLSNLANHIDTALYHEDLFHIDSLSNELKSIYGAQGGLPDGVETYYPLVSNTTWLDMTNSLLLSRALIAADSAVYAGLWKAAKGMSPPLYQPHSLLLRNSAEIAVGLLKIADKETDLARLALYRQWAIKALDSLATMQLPGGAFPVPDLRTYADPVFTSIIQNFLNRCGADSVNVLQNGWIVDDKGTGEFKFDAGVIANAYFEAYNYTGNNNYRNIALSVAAYLKPLHFNSNSNYNTFVSLGLTDAFELTSDTAYLNRAIINLRYSVYPGQTENGRWVDGHNANSRYHNIIIQNIAPTLPLIPAGNIYHDDLDTMFYRSVKNLIDYTNVCGSATGYRWLLKTYKSGLTVLPASVKTAASDLIGRYINQSAVNGKYLDVQTMGDYLELIGQTSEVSNIPLPVSFSLSPNPATNTFTITVDESMINSTVTITDLTGRKVAAVQLSTQNSTFITSNFANGVYLITITGAGGVNTAKKLVISR